MTWPVLLSSGLSLTPFGALTILSRPCRSPCRRSRPTSPSAGRRSRRASLTGGVTTFSAVEARLPLVVCAARLVLNSPWYRTDAYHAILAVSISSAFPLSWHMAFVAIPASGAPFLAPLLGLSESALKVCHIRSAWASVFWACVHVGGQLFYLLGTSSFVDSFALSPYSDNLLFWFGAATILLLLVHAALAKLRHHPAVQPHFRTAHRTLAFVLLLSATTHWWPFALFLAPAVAVAATGLAVRASTSADAGRRGAMPARARRGGRPRRRTGVGGTPGLHVGPSARLQHAVRLPAGRHRARLRHGAARRPRVAFLAPSSAASVMSATLLAEGVIRDGPLLHWMRASAGCVTIP